MRKPSVSPEVPHQSGLPAFGDTLCDCETIRLELGLQHFNFERHRFEQEMKGRVADRLECREERKEQNELDLKDFQMIFEMRKWCHKQRERLLEMSRRYRSLC